MTEALHSPPTPFSLLLVGAGGHGRVVADAALRQARWPLIRATDRDPARCQGELLPGVALLAEDAAHALQTSVHIAIGHNAARAWEVRQWGEGRLMSVIHPGAWVSPFSTLGPGSFVAAGAVLAPMARTGVACIVNHLAVVDHDVVLGDYCHIAPGARLGGGVVVGRRVLVGTGAVLLPGVQVADDVVIGAGAVVRQSLPEAGTYVGVPARKIP